VKQDWLTHDSFIKLCYVYKHWRSPQCVSLGLLFDLRALLAYATRHTQTVDFDHDGMLWSSSERMFR